MKMWVRMSAAVAGLALLAGCGSHQIKRRKTPVVGQRVPILMSENDIAPDKTIAAVSVALPAAVTNDAWSQPGGNPAKVMGHLALGASLSRAWQVSIPGTNGKERLGAAPTVADNKIFVVDVNGLVHAFAADSGQQLWTTPTAVESHEKAKAVEPEPEAQPDKDQAKDAPKGKRKHRGKDITKRKGHGAFNRAARFGGGVSYDDGKVFATNGLGDVVAMDAKTGAPIWTKKPGGPLRGAPSIALGNVFVMTQDNQLFALNETTGDTVWTQSASLETQGVFGVGAPAVAQGTVVAGFSSGELNAYRYENGRTLWGDALSRTSMSTSVSSLSDVDAEPVIDAGRVYAIGQGGRMISLAIDTGQRIWEQNLAGIATPWLVDPWLFVATDDGRLICIAATSGKIRWIKQLDHFSNEKKKSGAFRYIGPILAGGRLLLLSSRGEIVSASPEDGSVQSTIRTKTSFTLAPVVANGTLYLLDDKGQLSAWR